MHTNLEFVAALAILSLGADLAAQDLRLRDHAIGATGTYDSARQALIGLGSLGETLEFDGTTWRQRALPRQNGLYGKVAYDEQRRCTWFVGSDDTQQFVTSRFDGSTWRDLNLATTPSPRTQFSLAYDTQRGELVLFGGQSFTHTFLADTWTFDGSTWQQRSPNTVPPARSNAGASYDSHRGRVVLYGGLTSFQLRDTWEWDGTDWTLANNVGAPSIRWDPGMTYDPQRQRTLLFGGFDGTLHDDLWEWDGASWAAVPTPPLRPAPRMNPVFAFDAHLGESVLAGRSDNDLIVDTWSWNGTRWLRRDAPTRPLRRGNGNLFASPAGELLLYSGTSAPPTTWRWTGDDWSALPGLQPSPRYSASSCTGQQLAYLFGGFDPVTYAIGNDLWGYDGLTWQQLSTNGPVNGIGAALAYDWARGELLLFGGNGGSSGLSSDTWIFRNGGWVQASPNTTPPARTVASATFDFNRGAIVMVGGWGGPNNFLADAWQWNGVDWSPLPPLAAAPSLGGNQLGFDANRGTCVMTISGVGGRSLDAYELTATGWAQLTIGDAALASGLGSAKTVVGFPFADGLALGDERSLFTLDLAQARRADYGAACTATAPLLAANTWPRPGNSAFAIDCLAAQATPAAALLLGLQSATTPIATCTLRVGNGVAVLLPLNAGGFGSSPLPIPNDRAFLGLDVFAQAATLDANAPSGFTLSAGLQVTIGS